MTSIKDNQGPVEVWLSRQNMEVTCLVVFEDESTDSLDIDSLSMRGAQREITGWLIDQGYTPIGRWAVEEGYGGKADETMRQFKRTRSRVEEIADEIAGQALQKKKR